MIHGENSTVVHYELKKNNHPERIKNLRLEFRPLIALLSNGSPRMVSAAVESASLNGVFTNVVSVDEVKIYKTSPRVYGLVSQHLGVADSAVAFVSSNFWDIAGAKSFEFWTCWVNRGKLPEEELGITPDVTVTTLDGLVNVLGDTNARREYVV